MHRAKSNLPGVANFLLQCKCKTRNIPVCIVSHKTEYGHYDEKNILLKRRKQLKWMFEEEFI